MQSDRGLGRPSRLPKVIDVTPVKKKGREDVCHAFVRFAEFVRATVGDTAAKDSAPAKVVKPV